VGRGRIDVEREGVGGADGAGVLEAAMSEANREKD